MKQLIFTMMFCVLANISFGQISATDDKTKLKNSPTWRAIFSNNNVFRTYDNIKDMLLVRDLDGNFFAKNSEQKKYELDLTDRPFVDYKILREADGFSFIKILPCVKLDNEKLKIIVEKDTDGKCPSIGSVDASQYVFAVETRSLNTFKKVQLSSRLVLTPIVHPIKFRPSYSGKEANLTGEVTLSYNLGYRIKMNKNLIRPTYLTVVPYGFGISTSQYFKKNTTDRPVPGNISLTYLSFGTYFTFDRYSIGFFAGKDAMFTNSQKDWHYQNQFWYSFGFGYSLK